MRGIARRNSLRTERSTSYGPLMPKPIPFRYYKTLPEVTRLAVLVYVRVPLYLRSVEGLLR